MMDEFKKDAKATAELPLNTLGIYDEKNIHEEGELFPEHREVKIHGNALVRHKNAVKVQKREADDDGGLEWWAILLIVLIVLLSHKRMGS